MCNYKKITKVIRDEMELVDYLDLKDILRLEVARRREELKMCKEDTSPLFTKAQFKLNRAERLYETITGGADD